MFVEHISIFIVFGFLPLAAGRCWLDSDSVLVCQRFPDEKETLELKTIFNEEHFHKFSLTGYRWDHLILDDFPSSAVFLNLSGNVFSKLIINKTFALSSKLRQLILESNNLEQMNIHQIYFPPSLERISLANNRLKAIDVRLFSRLRNLTELDLRNNLLKRISPDIVHRFSVRLDGNPLDCHCTSLAYKEMCQRAMNTTTIRNESEDCFSPRYHSLHYDGPSPVPAPPPYLRFSTFTLICPIVSKPTGLIIWSTPFGYLSSVNATTIDLVPIDLDRNIYVNLVARSGPIGTRIRHVLSVDQNRLTVTGARAALEKDFSCTAINMLGVYRHDFQFTVETNVKKGALRELFYTLCFGFFMSLIGGALCISMRVQNYTKTDQFRTPPIYPTLTPNSAARTPPNFEFNQWWSTATANITESLEQVRERLWTSVQHVTGHVGRASGRLTQSVQQAAGASADYLQSVRVAGQQYLSTMRVQTLSSLRNSGHLMRAGMNILTTQVNSLRDFCGVTSGVPSVANYVSQQRDFCEPTLSLTVFHSRYAMPTILEETTSPVVDDNPTDDVNESMLYAGRISSHTSERRVPAGRLQNANQSASSFLNDFDLKTADSIDDESEVAGGCVGAGIGIFQMDVYEPSEQTVQNSDQVIFYDKITIAK